MSKPSVILLGSKPGAVVALRTLTQRGWDVRAVVADANPVAWLPGPALAEEAAERGIALYANQKQLPPEQADFVISYMYRKLVRKPTLDLARRAALNFHAGPLPEFGGWAFYNVAILESAPEYGCTCHYMDEGFDTGPLLRVRRFPIDAAAETAYSLERKAQGEMVRLFAEFCELAETGEPLPRVAQDPAKMRYLRREEFERMKEIPAGADAETVDRIARAFWYPPYECAWIRVGGVRLEVVPEIAKLELARALHRDDLLGLVANARS